jgi:hypothetical protein
MDVPLPELRTPWGNFYLECTLLTSTITSQILLFIFTTMFSRIFITILSLLLHYGLVAGDYQIMMMDLKSMDSNI